MPASTRGNWPKVAIGGLVLLNIVLLALLVLREPSRTVAAVPVETESATPTRTRPTESRSPSPTPSPSSTVTTSSPTATPTVTSRSTRLLAVNSETLAWRGVLGPCPTTPDLEVSRDGGRTWQPTSAGLRSVTRLRSFGGSSVFAVGGSEDCTASYVAAGGPGDAWRPDDAMLGETWHRLPDAPYRVQAPGGRVSRPCGEELADFAGLGDDNAAAVCADGTIRTTTNSGRTWRALESGKQGLAIAADDGAYVVALGGTECEGIGVTVLGSAGEQVDDGEIRCAPVAAASSGELAVAIRDRVLWVWSGSKVAVSTDHGRSWEQA